MTSVEPAPTPIAAELARFCVEAEPALAAPALGERAALHLLDALGCGLAAVGLGAGGEATAVAAAQGGVAEASVLGEAAKLPAPLAALANGSRCHALDFDDTHEAGICHSSAVLAAASLAAGEAAGRSGAAVLDAFLLGSEVALRIATALADDLYARGFHPTSVCGSFGAAAAASRLLGLDSSAAAKALGIVGSFAAGLFEYLADGSATKPLHAGWAAQAGIQAARLAAAGASGPATVLEGRFGLLASHGGGEIDPEPIRSGLGERWELERISFKAFPACHFAHSSTWAALELVREHELDPGEIAEVVVSVPPEGARLVLEPIAAKRAPRTPYDAKFSLPYTLAHNVLHGELGLAAFEQPAIREPRVLELAARVRAEPAPERLPSRFCGGTEIVTAAGERHRRFVEHPPGSPGNPLPPEWLLAKFHANAGFALGAEAVAELARLLPRFEDEESAEPAMAIARTATAPDGGTI